MAAVASRTNKVKPEMSNQSTGIIALSHKAQPLNIINTNPSVVMAVGSA
jgi:hypothetical protein